MTTPDDLFALIDDVFAQRGAVAYFGEAVTQAEHMLQTAALAEEEQAGDALIVAALLHDIGHLMSGERDDALHERVDHRHDQLGARVLARWFPPLVVDAVRLHVAAKRYLCAVEPDYHADLSPASQHSLMLQGGPMTPPEVAMFEAEPFHAEAVRLRRWDDRGKVPGLAGLSLDRFRPMIARIVQH